MLVPSVDALIPVGIDAAGAANLSLNVPAGLPAGSTAYLQAWFPDAATPHGWAASNGLQVEST